MSDESRRFGFVWDDPVAGAARAFGVSPRSAHVDVTSDRLEARFGPWVVRTPRHNVLAAEPTGPYRWWKVTGPAHLSLADLGLTFATTARRGVCLRFRDPVPGIDPFGMVRHPGLTVTVDDVDGLTAMFPPPSAAAAAAGTDGGMRKRVTRGAIAGTAGVLLLVLVMGLRRAGHDH